jgi:hypothetical protein
MLEAYRHQKKLTTTLDLKDAQFLAERRIKAAHVLRGAIRDLRDKEVGVLPDYEKLSRQRDAIHKLLERARDFIEKNGLMSEYLAAEDRYTALERANSAKEKV